LSQLRECEILFNTFASFGQSSESSRSCFGIILTVKHNADDDDDLIAGDVEESFEKDSMNPLN